MNELRRRAYLEALGVDSYISRAQLPGAAVTRRLAIVPTSPGADPAASNEVLAPEIAAVAATSPVGERQLPRIDVGQPAQPVTNANAGAPQEVPRFRLATIVAGDWLWLEELDDMPLATEQLQLIQAMARALNRAAAKPAPGPADLPRPDVALFDWPIHHNQQLELGAEAARASVAGFIGRRLTHHQCRGLVLLGGQCRARVPLEQIQDVSCVSTPSSAEMLAQPQLKRQAWLDLLALVTRS